MVRGADRQRRRSGACGTPVVQRCEAQGGDGDRRPPDRHAGERRALLHRRSAHEDGVAIQRSPRAIRADAERGRPFGNEATILLEIGGEKVSTQEVSGRTCDLYRLTNKDGRHEVCISRDEARLPVLVRIWSRASGKEALTRYLDWTRGLALSDAFFEPEPDVKLEPLSYEEYVARAGKEQIGPAPPFFRDLLHGTR